MFSRIVSGLMVLCVKVPNKVSTAFVSWMSNVANVAARVGVVLRYPPPYRDEHYILRYAARLDAYQLTLMPVSQALTAGVDNEQR